MLYTYNGFNQLTQVSMTRGSTTQIRTFTYDANQRLSTLMQPEIGTTTYQYDIYGRTYQVIDPRSTRRLNYDIYGRLSRIAGIETADPYQREDPTEEVSFRYDTLVGAQPGDNLWGRLAEVVSGNGVTERYTYTKGGRVTKKTLTTTAASGVPGINLAVNYAYNPEGTVARMTYPSHWQLQGGSYVQASGTDLWMYYDWARRPRQMRFLTGSTIADSFSYNAADQLISMNALPALAGGAMYTETRQYNLHGQLTRQTVPGEVDIEYRFSATANDGKLWQRKDWVLGEEVTYQYDQIGRLIAAATTGPEWGQSYTYDGFGNLTQQAVTKGTAPSMSMMVDPATNRLAGAGITYTGGGNLQSDGIHSFTYDRKNRVKTVAGETYAYSWKNERVLVTRVSGVREIHFYGAGGEKLGVYAAEYDAAQGVYVAVRQSAQERVYFGGRLLYLGGEKVISDRLGSVVRHGTASYRYYPYGQEIGGATTNDKPKFGTYTRDASTGLDYAMNRYYKNEWGRFTTPDPYRASGGPADPGSWNRYSYVGGDPVNYLDRYGLQRSEEYVEDAICWIGGQPIYGGEAYLCNEAGYIDGKKKMPDINRQKTITKLQAQASLKRVVATAIEALRDNEECMGLFGNGKTRQGKFNLITVLESIASGGEFGNIIFEFKSEDFGAAQVVSTAPLKFPFKVSSVNIIINLYNDEDSLSWADGLLHENALTLLHELGHAYDMLRGSGGSQIKSPDSLPGIFGGDKRSHENDWLVDQKCFGGTLGYKKP